MSAQASTPAEWFVEHLHELYVHYKGNPGLYFEHFIKDLVALGVTHLEGSRNRHAEAGENALTDVLIGPLKGAGYNVASETNANGHVDVVLKFVFPGMEWKGEAKICSTYPWYESGIIKLVEKYSSGSEDYALMLGFCRHPDMHTAQSRYRGKIEELKPAEFQKWDELKTYRHPNIFVGQHLASGRPILVTHVWSNCHYVTDEALFAEAAKKRRALKDAGRLDASEKASDSSEPEE